MFATATLALSSSPASNGLPPADVADHLLPRGCGWFESSRELVQGIKVIEHQGFDGLSFEVPLSWQLAACC